MKEMELPCARELNADEGSLLAHHGLSVQLQANSEHKTRQDKTH